MEALAAGSNTALAGAVGTGRPVGIDLFSGVGGMSLGFEQAGFDVAAAVELDPVHACVHSYNFPNCEIIPNSVARLSGSELRSQAGLVDRPVDVVFGGAPCQGFSLIGRRAIDDPRNSLVRDFARLVAELDARSFVFENVKGLTIGRHRVLLEELIELFESLGYVVRTPWQVLDAANFGTPQDRRRLFLLGVKQGAAVPSYPSPITAGKGDDDSLPRGPTCYDALSDLPNPENYSELETSDAVRLPKEAWGAPCDYAAKMRTLERESWAFGYVRRWDPALLSSSARTHHTNISRRRFSSTAPGTVEPISRFFRLSPDGVANTLRAGTDSSRGAFTSPRPIHFAAARCVTVREMARLHGFPDWFRFHATKWHGARQVGNAVPPPLAKAVAEAVAEALGVQPIRPNTIQDLGDEALLSMGMSDAAKYWGVPVPIGKRDRKSGDRKRKQHEIERERLMLSAA